MSESLTLRTAFFNLVGGRRQDSSEGFRVNGNLRTHSGESLGFYAVSEATPPGPMGSRARRLVLDVFEEEVASEIELSIGSRLRHGVSQAHLALQSEFNGHVQVGLTVVISSENSIYLLQVAPAQAYVKHDDALHAISPTGNAQAGFSRALGGQAEPEVFLFRDSIEEGDLILLTTSWVAQALDPDHLRDAFAEEGPRKVTRTLFDLARNLGATDLTCVALEANAEIVEQPDATATSTTGLPPPRTVWEYVDEAVGSLGYVVDRARQELRPGSPPRTGSSGSGGLPNLAPSTLSVAVPQLDDEEPVLEDLPTAPENLQFDWPQENLTEELPVVPPQAASESPAIDSETEPSELDRVNRVIRQTSDLHRVTPPVQAFPDTNVSPERIYAGSGGKPIRHRELYGGIGSPGRTGTPSASRRRTRRAGRKPSVGLGAIPPAMLLWSGIGVGLVLLIIVLSAVFLGGGPNYGSNARSEASLAVTAFHAGDTRTAKHDLAVAWSDVALARKHNSKTDAASAAAFVQSASDVLHSVFRPKPSLLVRITAHRSHLTQLATGTKDLFILDSGRRQIWAIDPSHPVRPRKPAAEMGDANYNTGNGQVTFTTPRFLTAYANDLVAMDEHLDIMVQDPTPGTPPLTVQSLYSPGVSTKIVSITSWQGNLYVLDAHTGQVFRYIGTGNAYTPFTPSAQQRLVSASPLLHNATSVAVAHGGILVALRGGQILRFAQDKQDPNYDSRTPFSVGALPVKLDHISEIYARDDLSHIFLLNSAANKIVELTENGAYVRAVILPALKLPVRSISISKDESQIYLTSGHAVYSVPVNPAK